MKFIVLFLAVIGLASCSTSPDVQYYTLSAVQPAEVAPIDAQVAVSENWVIIAVRIPEMLDRSQIVLRSGENEVTLLDYNRWAEPLDSMIARVLNEDLAMRTTSVSQLPTEHKVLVTIDELDADRAGHVVLKASWTVQTGTEKQRFSFEGKETANDPSINASVVGMSHLLGELASHIQSQH